MVPETDMSNEGGEDYVHWLDGLWKERLLTARDRKPDLTIGILLWPTFPMMSLTGIVEPLRHAADFADNSRPLYCRWSIMGEPGHSAVASCGIRVQADASYVNPTDFDYIVVIGGLLPHLRAASSRHRDYLRVAASAGVPIIGVCTGVFVLAQEGLLTGHKASIHPFHAEDFRMAFPRLAFSTRDDFLIDKGRITVPGGISVLSLMTDLIRTHCGPDRAAKVVHQLSLSEQKSMSAFDHERATAYRNVADSRIQRAVVLIESRKGRGVSPEQAAQAVGLSHRQFARLFQQHTHMTPKRFILETRLRYARFLVENSMMPMTSIAFETGFSDSAHFATAFRARYGVAPSKLR
ncbi:helix-turn-helix domain-containing protein [Pararhizobium sp. LjRoot255]|uniref:GlxA family transcriptional regulator n=1 Tax=Pararhizobium sp. LjRoot255 TaxID=3342298 RepID=UPI003ED0F899